MNRLRHGAISAVLATLLLASTAVVLAGPLLSVQQGRDAALERWLRSRIGVIDDASIEEAIDIARASPVHSLNEGLLVFARTLIRLDEQAAVRLAGMSTTSPEVLLQALEFRLQRAIGDSMAPQERFTVHQIDRFGTTDPFSGSKAAVFDAAPSWKRAALIAGAPVVAAVLLLRALSSARPLGP